MRERAQHWSEAVRDCETHHRAYVIVTVLGARGSTPRDAGTKMVVTAAEFHGSIGGGELEHRALGRARQLLDEGRQRQCVENYPLGEKLGQCCGGSTSLLYECCIPACPDLYLFGAGHVGRALAPMLAALPMRVYWVDSREQEFPASIPGGVVALRPDNPVDCISSAVAQSYYVIMTHQHPLDYALLEAVLRRGDAAYVGVIGSKSKWRRFRMRLAHRGYDDADTGSVHCPIGLSAVPGKRPAEIAVSVAAELIAHYHARSREVGADTGPGWKDLQRLLARTGALIDGTATESP